MKANTPAGFPGTGNRKIIINRGEYWNERIGFLRIEIKGHPSLEENREITGYCLQHGSGKEHFKKYMKYKNIVLVEVKANLITLWKDGGREFLDFTRGKAYRIG
ncbi:MAG: hypothetical protein GX494_12630 [Clostridiaceae bacterium]|nr:hypothetical protein [Clostridiaceae bacterium]